MLGTHACSTKTSMEMLGWHHEEDEVTTIHVADIAILRLVRKDLPMTYTLVKL